MMDLMPTPLLINVLAILLAFSWIGLCYFVAFKNGKQPKRALFYILISATLVAVLFYDSQIYWSVQNGNGLAEGTSRWQIPIPGQIGLLSVKATIALSVFLLVQLRRFPKLKFKYLWSSIMVASLLALCFLTLNLLSIWPSLLDFT